MFISLRMLSVWAPWSRAGLVRQSIDFGAISSFIPTDEQNPHQTGVESQTGERWGLSKLLLLQKTRLSALSRT